MVTVFLTGYGWDIDKGSGIVAPGFLRLGLTNPDRFYETFKDYKRFDPDDGMKYMFVTAVNRPNGLEDPRVGLVQALNRMLENTPAVGGYFYTNPEDALRNYEDGWLKPDIVIAEIGAFSSVDEMRSFVESFSYGKEKKLVSV